MAIYEYRCSCNHEFEELRPMSECHEPSTCPKCGGMASRLMSNTHFRMAEPFRVVDSNGNVTKEEQVLRNTPDWQETKPVEVDNPGVPRPIVSRGGNVYYPRKQRPMVSA